MNTDGIYVTLSTFSKESPQPEDLLKQSGIRYGVNPTGKRIVGDELVERSRGYQVLVAGVEEYTTEIMDQLPGLKAISRCGVGTEAIDHEAALERGIAILNTPQEPVQAVAELTLSLMFALMRELPRLDMLTREKQWKRITGHLLSEQRVGLIGLGRIGQTVAKMLQGIGAEVIGYDPAGFAPAGVEMVSSLSELLEKSQIVSIHAAPGSVYLDKALLQQIPKGSWVVNTSRGGMLDEAALLELLDADELSGAALDVFSEEPYRGALCDSDKVVLTPHQATLTVETRVAMESKAVQNAIDYLKGV
ncbi:MAG: NAD(P)-dependent oxidoreductase [Verrucomicrobiota bacterium]